MPKVKVNGIDFYYELYGTGNPLVLVTGYGGDHSHWSRMIDKLSTKHKVLVFDNQGIGQTKDDGKPLSAESMADNTVALAKQLGFSRFSIAGHSMGGTIAQMAVIRHPEAIDKLIISCSPNKWNPITILAFQSMNDLMDFDIPARCFFELSVPWCYGAEFVADKKKLDQLRIEVLQAPYPTLPENILRQFETLKNFDSTNLLGKISVPTLIITASHDLIASKEETDVLIEKISGSSHIEIHGGHNIPIEQPDKWAKCVMEFTS